MPGEQAASPPRAAPSKRLFELAALNPAKKLTAAFLAGSGGPYGDGTWLLYYSMIACPPGIEFNPVCQQLPAAWTSWDPSPSWAERIARANQAINASTADIKAVNDYRQAVVEEGNEKWDAYIRQ